MWYPKFTMLRRWFIEIFQDNDDNFSVKRTITLWFVLMWSIVVFFVLHFGIRNGQHIPDQTLGFLDSAIHLATDIIKFFGAYIVGENVVTAAKAVYNKVTCKDAPQ